MRPARMFYWLMAVTVLLTSLFSTQTLPLHGQPITNNPVRSASLVAPQLTPTPTDAEIEINPTQLAETHISTGQVTTQTLTISNLGESLLTWMVYEHATVAEGANPATSVTPVPFTHSVAQLGAATFRSNTPPSRNADSSMMPQVGAYAFRYEAQDETNMDIVSFNLTEPDYHNIISATTREMFAGDFAGSDFTTLFTLDFNTNELVSINTETGAETVIGTSVITEGEFWTGMAWDPTTNTMYASGSNCNGSHLYTINLTNGTATIISAIPTIACLVDIAVSPDGQMYGVDIDTDSLHAINKTTGAATLIGSIGFDANYSQSIDFDDVNTLLYYAAYNQTVGNGELRTVNIATGNTVLIGDLGTPLTQIAAFGVTTTTVACPVSGNIPWLSIAPTSGTTSQTSSTDITVTFDSTGLANGMYEGTICIESNDQDEPFVNIPVTLNVTVPTPTPTPTATPDPTQPEIFVSPASMFEAHVLGATVTTQTLAISNVGGVPLTWTIQEGLPDSISGGTCPPVTDSTWLSAAPLSGTTLPNSTDTVEVTFDSTEIPNGDYPALLCIQSNDVDESVTLVPVELFYGQLTAVEQSSWFVTTRKEPIIGWGIGGLAIVGAFLLVRRSRS